MSVEVKNLTKKYKVKGSEDIFAINDISFNLPDTGLVFILGKSGCGKSTLLNLLGGIDGFDSGDILIDNQSIKNYKENEYDKYRNYCVGFVFQENNLLEEYTVSSNIKLALDLRGEKNAEEKIEQVLDRVHLKGFSKRKCNCISGGQKQRVAIARAIIKQPKILLCDEPTGALDSETSIEIFNLLREISQTTLVVVVSHDRENAEKYADRIIELKDGKILSDTKPLVGKSAEKKQIQTKIGGMKINRALTLGLSMLKSRPIRFAVCILICLLTFIAVGVASSIKNYSRPQAIYQTMIYNKSNHITLSKYFNSFGWQKTMFDKTDIDRLNEQFNVKFDCLYDAFNRLFINTLNFNLNKDNISQHGYLSRNFTFNGIIETDEMMLNKYGYVLYGNLPQNISEVAIPLHIYKAFEKFGYRESKLPNTSTEISSVNDIIGKMLVLNYGQDREIKLTISGVVDTGVNTELYGQIYDFEYPNNLALYNNDAKISRMLDGLHRAIFVFQKFNDYISYEYGQTHIKYLIAPFSKNNKTHLQILSGYSFDDLTKTDIENEARYDIDAVDNILTVLADVFLYVSLAVIIVTLLYILYYISGIIAENNKKIGIMRSIGATRFDIFKVFITALFTFTFCLILISAIFSSVAVNVLNSVLTSKFSISAILISFGIKQLVILSIVAISSVCMGIVLPLINLLMSKPADIIAGRK